MFVLIAAARPEQELECLEVTVQRLDVELLLALELPELLILDFACADTGKERLLEVRSVVPFFIELGIDFLNLFTDRSQLRLGTNLIK